MTSARLAGLSTAVRRSLFAAAECGGPRGRSRRRRPTVRPARQRPRRRPLRAAEPVPPAVPPRRARRRPPPPVPGRALRRARTSSWRTATTAVLGRQRRRGRAAPDSSRFHWDGTVVRLPSELFAARVARIDADPRVSVLVAARRRTPGSRSTASATSCRVTRVEAEMLTILRKSHDRRRRPTRRGPRCARPGNPVVIEVRPTRYLWRLG